MVTYQHPGSNSSPQAAGEAEQLVPQPPQPTPNANVKETLVQFSRLTPDLQHRLPLFFTSTMMCVCVRARVFFSFSLSPSGFSSSNKCRNQLLLSRVLCSNMININYSQF